MNRLKEADFLRGLGIVAVIIIHLTSTYINFSPNSYTYLIWGSINRFCGFAVPLFLAVSMLVMTYKAKEIEKLNVVHFYIKRFSKVIGALIIWSGIYIVYLKLNGYNMINPLVNPFKFIVSYGVLGSACYHLYFIPIIVQLYLIFPLIWLLVKWIREKVKINFYAGFVIYFAFLIFFQWMFAKINQWYIYENFKSTAILLPSYILPVGVGAWLGVNFREFYEKRWIFKVLIFIATIFVGIWYINGQLFNYGFYIRVLPMLYAALIILSLAILVGFIKDGNVLSPISKKSFFIYLIHPLIMFVLEINFKWNMLKITNSVFINYSLDFIVKFVIVFGFSYIVAWVWEVLKKKLKQIYK